MLCIDCKIGLIESGVLFMKGLSRLNLLRSNRLNASAKLLSADLIYFTLTLLLNVRPFKVNILINFMHFSHFEARLLTILTTAVLSQ